MMTIVDGRGLAEPRQSGMVEWIISKEGLEVDYPHRPMSPGPRGIDQIGNLDGGWGRVSLGWR